MESVPAKGTVRRTVRTAVALLLGQALLCALIGWLTFGRSPATEPAVPPGVDHMAVPPLAPLPSVGNTTPAPARSSTASGAASGASATRRYVPPPRRTPEKPAPAPETPASPAAPAPPPASTSLEPITEPPAPPEAADVQEPVTVGDRCRPEWAFGRTADGELAQCLRERHQRPRWKIA